MKRSEVEAKLNSLQQRNLLKTKESFELIAEWVKLKVLEEYGFEDDIKNYNNIKVEESISFNYHTNLSSKNIQTLYIFNHGGIDTPVGFSDFLNLETWFDYANCIYENYDIGTRRIASELLTQLSGNPGLNYAVIFFTTNRLIADSNRLRRHEQMVEKAYRGDSIWSKEKNSQDRILIGERLIDPFFTKIQEIIELNKINLVFNPHSYDVYGGGNSSSNHERATAEEKRPPFTLIKKYAFETEAFGEYKREGKVDIDLLNENDISSITKILVENLSAFKIDDIEKKVTVDYPYSAPRMMAGLIKTYYDGPVFATDIRKDLFKENFQQIINCINQITESFSKKP